MRSKKGATFHLIICGCDYNYNEVIEQIEKLKESAKCNQMDIGIYQEKEWYYSNRIIN